MLSLSSCNLQKKINKYCNEPGKDCGTNRTLLERQEILRYGYKEQVADAKSAYKQARKADTLSTEEMAVLQREIEDLEAKVEAEEARWRELKRLKKAEWDSLKRARKESPKRVEALNDSLESLKQSGADSLSIAEAAALLDSVKLNRPIRQDIRHAKSQYQAIKRREGFSGGDLEQFLRQKPNRNFLFGGTLPYLRLYLGFRKGYLRKREKGVFQARYQKIEKKYEKKIAKAKENKEDKLRRKKEEKLQKIQTTIQEGNWFMRVIGEPPVFYDSTEAYLGAEQMRLHMASQGYFQAETSYQAIPIQQIGGVLFFTPRRKSTVVLYRYNENEAYRIRNISYDASPGDYLGNNQRVIDDNIVERLLWSGEIYSEETLSAERDRLFSLYQDYGMYHFKRQYVVFEVDTTVGEHQVDIACTILRNETENGIHIRWLYRNVYVIISDESSETSDTVVYNGINYLYGIGKYSKKVMDAQLRIRPNETYNRSKVMLTQRLLGGLDIFKYVNIQFEPIDTTDRYLDTYLTISSFPKYQITAEAGVNLNLVSGQGIPGPFLSLSFKDRKLFRGFEILEITGRYSSSGQASAVNANNVLLTQELSLGGTLIFPKLLFPVGKKLRYKLADYGPKTRLSVGVTDIKRPEFRRTAVTGNLLYDFRVNDLRSVQVSPINLSLINTRDKTAEFDQYLNDLAAQGNNLIQSFEPSIITSVSASTIYNFDQLRDLKSSRFSKFFAELGGTLPNLYAPVLGEPEDSLFGLPFYRFVRFGHDFRYYIPFNKQTTLAFRFNGGLAKPIGTSTTLPYEKFFFAGGSNSVRAWLPRRLGPGSYSPPRENDGTFDYSFEQPGEILLELSIELRQKLFSFIHGAVFVDAGNVWSFDTDVARPGSQFKASNALGELGVGTGLGLRFDFSFIILRFDVGAKVWDPAEPLEARLVNPAQPKNWVLNFGIGYPF